MGFGVWGVGFGVWSVGCGVWGEGLRVWGLGFRDKGLGFRVQGSGFRVWGLEVQGLGFRGSVDAYSRISHGSGKSKFRHLVRILIGQGVRDPFRPSTELVETVRPIDPAPPAPRSYTRLFSHLRDGCSKSFFQVAGKESQSPPSLSLCNALAPGRQSRARASTSESSLASSSPLISSA